MLYRHCQMELSGVLYIREAYDSHDDPSLAKGGLGLLFSITLGGLATASLGDRYDKFLASDGNSHQDC